MQSRIFHCGLSEYKSESAFPVGLDSLCMSVWSHWQRRIEASRLPRLQACDYLVRSASDVGNDS